MKNWFGNLITAVITGVIAAVASTYVRFRADQDPEFFNSIWHVVADLPWGDVIAQFFIFVFFIWAILIFISTRQWLLLLAWVSFGSVALLSKFMPRVNYFASWFVWPVLLPLCFAACLTFFLERWLPLVVLAIFLLLAAIVVLINPGDLFACAPWRSEWFRDCPGRGW